ncbi:dihydrofolate reductase [Agromyces hippuratus]|uniref:Dihydrofolate reductase n=1 Tax=Agromyces hippuratus TaxID=286438 RepID=A0A852X286_9MICO|nr:dihydrofolate reductase family protein [Agromyces hippuratus]NYG20205.1 dihydrofolate reductase [Agromyces hippuratus]
MTKFQYSVASSLDGFIADEHHGLGWLRSRSGDVLPIADAARAEAGERNVWIVGGGPIAAEFLEVERLDELLVTYMPVALGRGRPLLPVATATPRFTLVRTTPFPNGAVEHVYRTG